MHIKCRLSPIAQATTCDFRIECNNNGRAMPIRENRIYGIPSRWWFVCVCRVVSSSSHTECSEKIFILWIDYLNMCYLKTAYKFKKKTLVVVDPEHCAHISTNALEGKIICKLYVCINDTSSSSSSVGPRSVQSMLSREHKNKAI